MCGCCGDQDKTVAKSPVQPKGKKLFRPNVCCTDIPFLLVFLAYCIGMVIIAVYAITHGDATRLLKGYDSYGNTCDMSKQKLTSNYTYGNRDTSGLKHVFFMNVLKPNESLEICVKQCPDQQLNTSADVKDFAERTGSMLCQYNVNLTQYGDSSLYNQDGHGPCPALPIFVSTSVFSRCIPDPEFLFRSSLEKAQLDGIIAFLNADNLFKKGIEDIYKCWKQMIYLCLIALGFSFVMVFLMRFLAPIIVWFIVVLSAVACLVGSAFLWWTYVEITRDMKKQEEVFNVPVLDIKVKNQTAFLVFSIVATIVTVVLLLVILIMRKRFSLCVALFKEAGKCVAAMPSVLLQPFFTFIVFIIFLSSWLVVLAYLSTTGTPAFNAQGYGVTFVDTRWVRIMWWYHLVGLIWICEFIVACHQFVIVSSTTMWYFTEDKAKIQCTCLTGQSVIRLVLHHLGSIALGAFIITLVKIPRYILMYMKSKLDKSQSDIAKCCLKCCICCLWCLEKILKYINQNAYTVMAMKGSNFCTSAQKALAILVTNPLRVAAINSVGDFVLFLGKVAVAASVCAVSVRWLSNMPGLQAYIVPVAIVTIVAYYIAHCLIVIYEMIIDALLICFCYECEIVEHNDSYEPYMSATLYKLIKKSANHLDVTDGRTNERIKDNTEYELTTLRPSLKRSRPQPTAPPVEQ